MALLLIVPSLSLAYVVRMDDEPIRRALLSTSRSWAVFCILPLVVAAGALLLDYGGDQYLLGLIWLACAAATALSLRRNSAVNRSLKRLLRSKQRDSESTTQLTWSHQPIDFAAASKGLRIRRIGNGALTVVRLFAGWTVRSALAFLGVGVALLVVASLWAHFSGDVFHFFGIFSLAPGASIEQYLREGMRIATRTTPDEVGRVVAASGRGLLAVAACAAIAMATYRAHPTQR